VHKILEMIDRELQCIEDTNELNPQNIEVLGKLVDIKKDIYKIKEMGGEEEMRYDRYGAKRRDSRGRYMEGRRNRMPDMYWEKMMDGYEDYTDGMERYRANGNYGDHDKGMEALEYMLESVVDFVDYLHNNADSQEETELIKKYIRKLKEM